MGRGAVPTPHCRAAAHQEAHSHSQPLELPKCMAGVSCKLARCSAHYSRLQPHDVAATASCVAKHVGILPRLPYCDLHALMFIVLWNHTIPQHLCLRTQPSWGAASSIADRWVAVCGAGCPGRALGACLMQAPACSNACGARVAPRRRGIRRACPSQQRPQRSADAHALLRICAWACGRATPHAWAARRARAWA